MQVLNDSPAMVETAPRAMTPEAMQQDFDYMMAEKMSRKLYEKGLISIDELHKLSELNRQKFSPFYADLMA
ncbi:MAG: hypothetical protein Q4D29_01245 [Lachnospiraceae bacterium]|nr:hypothetical protein [Lachnospiraceae bacterium]